jgi:hypothetical protein
MALGAESLAPDIGSLRERRIGGRGLDTGDLVSRMNNPFPNGALITKITKIVDE